MQPLPDLVWLAAHRQARAVSSGAAAVTATRRGGDELLLRLAHELEEADEWSVRRPLLASTLSNCASVDDSGRKAVSSDA